MRSRHAAPQARRDRDLRCSTRPFAASHATPPALRMPEDGRGNAVLMVSATATLYAGADRLRLTAALLACPGVVSGVRAGGSRRLGSLRHPGPVRRTGPGGGHRRL